MTQAKLIQVCSQAGGLALLAANSAVDACFYLKWGSDLGTSGMPAERIIVKRPPPTPPGEQ
jgi:hypothetical protein